MWRELALFITVVVSGGLSLYQGRLAGPNAALLSGRLGLPARWDGERADWVFSPRERQITRIGGAAYLALFVVGVLTVGWVRGVGLLLATGLISMWIRSRNKRLAAPFLNVAVARARQQALVFRASGDATRADAADDLASRVARFATQAPTLTVAQMSRLPRRRRPGEIADLLDGWGRLHNHDDEQALSDWLDSKEWSPFPSDPEERRRAELLERVKQEILASGGAEHLWGTRLAALVADLRAFTE